MTPRPPYWLVGRDAEPADMLGDLLECWEDFARWVNAFPEDRYGRLRRLAQAGRVSGINELGLQLADALDGEPAPSANARAAAEALGEAILWRKVQWAQAHLDGSEVWPPADPAELVLLLGR